jgi:hypothetical protein
MDTESNRTDWPEYLTIRKLGDYLSISYRTLEGWKPEGFLPPHHPWTKRHHRWKKSDVDAWSELKRRGLFDDYPELRQQHGESAAWTLMLKRLADARERDQQLAAEVA